MVRNITTWSPDTCRCELNYITDTDSPDITEFYAVSEVCSLHEHLATKTHKSTHHSHSARKMNDIQAAMTRNLEQHNKAITRVRRNSHKRQLNELTSVIHKHNAEVKERWEETFSEPYAHDEHIYNIILKENQTKNLAIGHLEEQHGIANDKVQWHFEDRAPERKVVLTFDHPDHSVIQKSLSAKFADRVRVQPVQTQATA